VLSLLRFLNFNVSHFNFYIVFSLLVINLLFLGCSYFLPDFSFALIIKKKSIVQNNFGKLKKGFQRVSRSFTLRKDFLCCHKHYFLHFDTQSDCKTRTLDMPVQCTGVYTGMYGLLEKSLSYARTRPYICTGMYGLMIT